MNQPWTAWIPWKTVFIASVAAVTLALLFTNSGCQQQKASESPTTNENTPSHPNQSPTHSAPPKPTTSINQDALFQLVPGSESGITFRNDIAETNESNILTYTYMYNGGGVAVGDINNDGLSDVFLTSNQGSNKLYLNLGDMKFRDISHQAGIDQSRSWHSGVTMADVNQDGFLDIYVCCSGNEKRKRRRANQLWINQGDQTFQERAADYGVADTGHSTQGSFFDYDHDGDLDLFVLNHPVFFNSVMVVDVLELIKEPAVAAANSDNLYRNNGNGTFSQVTQRSGCQNFGYGLGLVTADLNDDGWADIYIANDFSTPDQMLINQKDGTFRDELKERTSHISYYGMGCDVFDFNNDSLPDIVEVDMTAQDRIRSKTLMPSMSPSRFHALIDDLGYAHQYMFNSLQLNQGEGRFSEIGLMAGVAKTDWSWAVLGADFDLDGWDDLLITNGFKRDSKDNDFLARYRQAKKQAGGLKPMVASKQILNWVNQIPSEKIANYGFQNHQDMGFVDRSTSWGLNDPSFSNGAAYADLDNDGDLDLIINNIDQEAFVYRNRAKEKDASVNHLTVVPVNNQAQPIYNTKVRVRYGNHVLQKELTPVRGYQSAVEPVLHFGLDSQVSNVDILVDWPDGTQSRVDKASINQRIEIPHASSGETSIADATKRRFQPAPKHAQIPFRHRENRFSEYKDEVLLPHSQSSLGPCVAVGDVNGDQLDDVFVGGAKGQAATLFHQQTDGSFVPAANQPWDESAGRENIHAILFDVDQDKDLDLYIANGGGSDFSEGSDLLQDQVFINQEGQFQSADLLPPMPISTGSVTVLDFDGDGDNDLFVGGRGIPGRYPQSSDSFLLEYNDGKFQVAEGIRFPKALGLVNDSIATDFNQDGRIDLLVVGEWTAIQLLENQGDQFVLRSVADRKELAGWWFHVNQGDFNSDGRPDYIVGNLGLNNKFHSKSVLQDSKKLALPKLKLFSNDFDGNSTLDIVLSKQENGIDYPLRGKECSTEQMPFIREKFPTYEEFALANLTEILGEEKLDESFVLATNTFESAVLLSGNNGYEIHALPKAAQIAPLRDTVIADIDGDGHLDILGVGNLYDTEVETTRYDAGYGIMLLGDGQGRFRAIPGNESGLFVKADSRRIRLLETPSGRKLVIGNNNADVEVYDFQRDTP